MKPKGKAKIFSEGEIDKIGVAQANDESAWQKPVRVKKGKPASLSLPSELAKRAVFFARLHREEDVKRWLTRVIQERIDMEEAVFAGLKRDMTNGGGV